MTRAAALSLAVLCCSCGGAALDSDGSGDDLTAVRLRLVAGNLSTGNNQSYDTGEGLRIFTGVHPDVAMIQEFNYQTNAPADYQSFANTVCGAPCYYFAETVPGSGVIPNGIVSRYPIKSSGRWVDSNVSNRGFAWAQIEIPGAHSLWVVSVHLLTSTGAHGSEGSEIVADLKSMVPAGDYLAIGGDFNSTSRTDAAVTALSALFTTTGPFPADQSANQNTNEPRNKAYDWVLVSPNLDAQKVPVVIGANSFANGLVTDTRVYTPIADLAPALAGDSGSLNMQHMAIVRDFNIAGDGMLDGGTASDGGTKDGGTDGGIGSTDGGTDGGTGATDGGTTGADAYEPDDTAAEAKPISIGETQLHNLGTATDQDWVKFVLTATTNVEVSTTGPAGGATYIAMYTSALGNLGHSTTTTGYATFKHGSLAAGTYYAMIKSENSQPITGYSLSLSKY